MSGLINISDKDIELAANKLLPKRASFNDEKDERINFIKCFDTVDLKACPGSGKTTCLQAKLLIIDKYLPLRNYSGILVLSHTNRAIDEIKVKLQPYCSRLFQHPNFIGTFQNFVDTFLTIPFCSQYFNCSVSHIDDELYKSSLWKKFQQIQWDENYGKLAPWFYQRHFNKAKKKSSNEKLQNEICISYIEEEIKDIYFDYNDEIIKRFLNDNTILKNKTNLKYIGLKKVIEDSIKDGKISFEYAYLLAAYYLKVFPTLINLFQKRFSYVFIDEMQDTDNHQFNLIEQIFRDSGTVIQRIGDSNQSIFNNVKAENVWKPPINGIDCMELTGSLRLSEPIALTIQNIALHSQELTGNEQNGEIQPYIILFDDNTKTNVISKFGDLIIEYNLLGKGNHIFKAVGWRKHIDNKTDVQLALNDYWEGYEKEKQIKKSHFNCLKAYLQYIQLDDNFNTSFELKPFYVAIMNAMVKALWKADKKTPEDKHFTISRLNKYLLENEKEFYYLLKEHILDWSVRLSQNADIDVIYNKLKLFIINDFRKIFDFNITDEVINYLNCDIQGNSTSTSETGRSNTYSHQYSGGKKELEGKEVNIQVSTIHGVKGETHTGTLYLETYYKNDSRKKDGSFISYESQRIMEQLIGKQYNDTKIHQIETLKMAYVGMSRPTHLLCVALHRDRVNGHETELEKNGWKIITTE